MKKKNRFAVILTTLAIAACATTGIAYAKAQGQPVLATEESNATIDLNGKVVIMRSFFGGYIVNPGDIDNIEKAAQNSSNSDLADMAKVIENGQRYKDAKLGCEYIIIRKPGNENTTFELPRQNPKFVYLAGYDFEQATNFYTLDKHMSNTQEIEGQFGDFTVYTW